MSSLSYKYSWITIVNPLTKNTLSCGLTKPLCQARRRKSERRQNKSFPAKDSPPSLEGNSRTPCPPPPPPLPLKGDTFLISSPLSPSPLPERERGKSSKRVQTANVLRGFLAIKGVAEGRARRGPLMKSISGWMTAEVWNFLFASSQSHNPT